MTEEKSMTKVNAKKKRLDDEIARRELAPSRSQAKALIMAGHALVNGCRVDKAGALVSEEDKITLKEQARYVGRGGFKLEKALTSFNVISKNKVCLDIGASTGGFTDCLLQNDAKKVIAIDVGYGQLHWKLQKDDRVNMIDRTNFRYFDVDKLTDRVNLVVMDVSFISIKKLTPKIIEVFNKFPGGEKEIISLIKPQFEVGKENVGKGGIVKDPAIHFILVNEMKDHFKSIGFDNIETTDSPIKGADGNKEFLIYGKWQDQ